MEAFEDKEYDSDGECQKDGENDGHESDDEDQDEHIQDPVPETSASDAADTKESEARNIQRYDYQIQQIIAYMSNFVKTQPVKAFLTTKDELIPVTLSTFIVLLKSDPKILSDSLLSCIPRSTKAILGRADLSIDDLRLLPRVTQAYKKAGCYLGLPIKERADDDNGHFESYIETVDGKPCEVGSYVGSTARKAGMEKRWNEHDGTRTVCIYSGDSVYSFAFDIPVLPPQAADAGKRGASHEQTTKLMSLLDCQFWL